MMGYDRICSSAIIAPITALAFDGSNTLYAGSGGQITAYSNIGVEDESIGVCTIGPIDIFSTDTVHGLKCVEESREVVAFGGKAVCITSLERRDGNYSVSDFYSSLVMKMLFDGLDDLVLDSIMIKDILFIGFAHNFIDVLVILPGYSGCIKLYRVQCPDISALFSLSIAAQIRFEAPGRNMKLLVASGTVFGKIILWNFDITAAGLHDVNCSNDDSHAINDVLKTPDVMIDNVLKSHEGVTFKLQWSKDRQKIASVSDDRTVRLLLMLSSISLLLSSMLSFLLFFNSLYNFITIMISIIDIIEIFEITVYIIMKMITIVGYGCWEMKIKHNKFS
jgi:WD40 repeat protein